MMEVKQSTPVPLMDFVSSNSETNNEDAEVLLNKTASKRFSTEKSKDVTSNGSYNKATGENFVTEIDDDLEFHDAIDLTEPINSDLEDALLAGDELSSNISSTEKVDKNNTVRDPADALDKLLSKISDIVDVVSNSDSKVEDISETNKTKTVEKEMVEDIIPQAEENPIESMDVDNNENMSKDEIDDDVVMVESTNSTVETPKNDNIEEEKEERVLSNEIIDKEDDQQSKILLSTEDGLVEGDENENKNEGDCETKAEEETSNTPEICEKKKEKADEIVENLSDNDITAKAEDIIEGKREAELLKLAEETNKETVEKENVEDKSTTDEICNEIDLTPADNVVNETVLVSTKDYQENVTEKEIVEKSQLESGIPTVTLDDEDDDEELVSSSSNVKTKQISDFKSEANIGSTNDNEIVCLDDDDDDEVETSSKSDTAKGKDVEDTNKEAETAIIKSTEESPLSKEENLKDPSLTNNADIENCDSKIISDNTDNACDGLNAEAAVSKNVGKMTEGENEKNGDDARSECSSSSNLLQETKAPSEVTYEERDEAEEEEGEDGDDVELIEDTADTITVRNSEEKEIEVPPPAKKIRLSTEDENEKNSDVQVANEKETTVTENETLSEIVVTKLSQAETATSTVETKIVSKNESITPSSLKRSFSDSSEGCSEQHAEITEEESAIKKLKTITEEQQDSLQKPDLVESSKLDIVQKPKKDKCDENVEDLKFHTLTAIGSDNPVPLYPAPIFNDSSIALPLEFLTRFKKSFNQMTKNDLEELVLQKIVEALVHENEFAEMRLLIEKQEKIIAAHRAKLNQLSKQFRDLEMVHSRVIKDMREKNKQYLMPVRITRAVGLQVSCPSARKDLPLGGQTQSSQSSSTSIRSPQYNDTIPNRLTSPQRSNGMPQNNSANISTTMNTGGNTHVRRGCAQKVTAQRPVEVSAISANPPMSSIPANFLRPVPPKLFSGAQVQNSPSTQSRILNKNISNMSQQPVGNSRARYSGGSSPVPQEQQQPQRKSSLLQQQPISRHQNNSNIVKANMGSSHKGAGQQQQLRRSDSSPLPTLPVAGKSTSSVIDQYKNSYNESMPGMPSVSITPARPKDKSVIDLTDEDDVAPVSAAQLNVSGSSRMRGPAQVHTNNISNISRNSGGVAASMARLPVNSNTRPQISPRQLSSLQAQKPNSQSKQSIVPPAGTSITRVAVSSSHAISQRLKYQHPASLPPTPPQTFNPGWKLPPPRPTIRINNLDNGIVISWTMEEPLERHADCVTYQIYAYQETNGPPSVDSWRHVGDVKAMLLPMAVTLTQFQEGQRYYFAVRAVDIHQRYGAFSTPQTWN